MSGLSPLNNRWTRLEQTSSDRAGSDTTSSVAGNSSPTAAVNPTTAASGPDDCEESSGSSSQTYVCAVCEEPARGFHFGAFTCEGCKSFFGRTCLRKNHERFECKNAGRCDVIGSNRTSCKACRYRRCVNVGMSPLNSRFGRRSKYFKVSMSTSQQQQQQPLHQVQHLKAPILHQPPCPMLPTMPITVTPPMFYPFLLSHFLQLYSLHHRNSVL